MNTKEICLAAVMAVLLLGAVPGSVRGLTVPDTVILNSRSTLYEPFTFDHARHIQFMKECSYCHHHTTGTLVQDPNCARCHRNSSETRIVSCNGCHLTDPFSAAAIKGKDPKAYHHDTPSLKAAMHRNCIDCHERMKGPTGCQDCHRRTKKGDAFYNSGAYAPANKPAKGGHGGH